jgi:hypothetical protein
VVKKGAVIGGNKGVGKQEDVHQLRILENSCMQYRFLNARAEAVAMAKNAAAEVMNTLSCSPFLTTGFLLDA